MVAPVLRANFLILALLLSLAAQAEASDRPNILILMAEDLSPRIGAFGDPLAHTPNIDRLAGEGVRYTNAFTTAGVCAPSRAAHITGMYQVSFGGQHMRTTRGPLGTYRAVPPPEVKAYPELLRAAGYYTFTDQKLDYQFSGPTAGSGPSTIWDAEGGEAFAAWRNRAEGQPFYGLVNFAVTHESGVFAPLGSWPNSVVHLVMQVMRAYSLPGAVDGLPQVDPAAIEVPAYYPDTATVRADMARHYDNIAVMDWQVGRVTEALREDGLLESTIIIWTTDHGDGLPRSKRELYDSGIHVPMIVRWPSEHRPPGVVAGSAEERLVSFIDFAPTLLRLAGVRQPPWLQGRDFLSAPPREYVYAARDRIDEVPDRQRAVRDARFKYIRSWHPQLGGGHALAFRDNIAMVREMRELYDAGELNAAQRLWFEAPGEERLFDTQADPLELKDLSEDPAYADDLARLRNALGQWRATVPDWSDTGEAEMLARFWPDGQMPVTPAPTVRASGGKLEITATDNASISYRVDEGTWRLYDAPLTLPPGAEVQSRAVRYGHKESDIVSRSLPLIVAD